MSAAPFRPGRQRTAGIGAWWRTSSIGGVAPFLLGVTLLGRAAQNTGQTSYPLIAHQIGIGNGVLGVVAAASGAANVLTAAVLGARVSARTSMAVLATGQAIVLAAFALLALPTGDAGVWAGAIALGAGGGLVFPATMTAIGAAPRSERARALAVYALALSIGLEGGPLVESGVLRLLGDSVRGAFGVLSVLPLAATAFGAAAARRARTETPPHATTGTVRRSGVETPPHAGDESSGHDQRADGPSPGARPAGAPAQPGATGTRHRLLRQPAFRLALATMLTYQAPFVALLAFAGLLARHADGAGAAQAELGFAAFFGVSLCVRGAVVAASPLRHRRMALTGAAIATATGLVILASGHGYGFYLIAMAVLGAPHGLTFPVASAILADGVDQADLGRANARLMASTNVATVLIPVACGWLAAAAGYRIMFLAVELPVLVFGGALLLELRRVPAARGAGPAPAPAPSATGRAGGRQDARS